MKVYYNHKHRDFTKEKLEEHIVENQLRIGLGTIRSAKILERKLLSNRGNALDGWILAGDGHGGFGLNIGQNPIGTGYQNYIPFLEEMNCQKIGGLFRVKSIVGMPLLYLLNGGTTWGYITPKSFAEMFIE